MAGSKPLTSVANIIRADINRIESFLVTTCAKDWWVYVLAAGPALMSLGLAIYSPDPKEFIHAVTGKSVVKHIRDKVLSSPLVDPVRPGEVRSAAWELPGAADKAAYGLFIIGSIEKAANIWHSNVMKLEPCKDPQGNNWQSGYQPFGVIYANGDWWFPAAWVFQNAAPFAPNPMDFYVAPYEFGSTACSISYLASFGVLEGWELQCICLQTGQIIAGETNAGSAFSNDTWTIAHQANIEQCAFGRNYRWRVRAGVPKIPPWNVYQAISGNCWASRSINPPENAGSGFPPPGWVDTGAYAPRPTVLDAHVMPRQPMASHAEAMARMG